MVRLYSFIVLALVVSGVSCQKSPESANPASSSSQSHTNRQVSQVKGVVVSEKRGAKEVEIKHEAIPGYMPAMTMPFEVKSANELAGLAAGDAVSFRMIVTDTDGWIDQIKKLPARTNGPTATVNPLACQTASEKNRIL